MNQFRVFLINRGITVRKSVAALRTSLQAISDNRDDEMSLRMRNLILGLQQDWIWTDKRIEMTTAEIKAVSESEASCRRLMTIPGIGPIVSTAVVAAVGRGEAYDRGWDLCRVNTAWAIAPFRVGLQSVAVCICVCRLSEPHRPS